jgi:CRISPR-associated protein Cas5d
VLEVWGDFACYHRPGLSVERFSYPCITPAAARGIFDAIYSCPSTFRWQVLRIELLAPPSYIALRRDGWAKADAGVRERMETTTEPAADRILALKDVRYRLHAEIRPWPDHEERQAALESAFRRRAEDGRCLRQPCLGYREFPASFRVADDGTPEPVDFDLDLGLMLYDVCDLSSAGGCRSRPVVSLFHAAVHGGVLEVPEYASPEVLKPPAADG